MPRRRNSHYSQQNLCQTTPKTPEKTEHPSDVSNQSRLYHPTRPKSRNAPAQELTHWVCVKFRGSCSHSLYRFRVSSDPSRMRFRTPARAFASEQQCTSEGRNYHSPGRRPGFPAATKESPEWGALARERLSNTRICIQTMTATWQEINETPFPDAGPPAHMTRRKRPPVVCVKFCSRRQHRVSTSL